MLSKKVVAVALIGLMVTVPSMALQAPSSSPPPPGTSSTEWDGELSTGEAILISALALGAIAGAVVIATENNDRPVSP